MEIPIELIALIGIILGVVGRTMLPYFKKIREDPAISFDRGYVATAVFSAIISAILVYPLFVIPDETPLKVLVAAVIFAWVTNDAANRLAK